MSHDSEGSDSSTDPILCTAQRAVATVTMNRPAALNALNLESWRSLRRVAERLAVDQAIRVVVVTGAGDASFSTGADITEFPSLRREIDQARRYGEAMEAAIDAWERLPQPVIAVIRGYCLGGGLEFALAADVRVAEPEALFGIPATRRGFGVSVAAARRLSEAVGVARARALLLTSDQVTAVTALGWGLVDEVVPASELAARVEALALRLASHAPLAMAWIKEAMRYVVSVDSDAGLSAERRLGAHLFATKDGAEGVASFLERRRARFEGR